MYTVSIAEHVFTMTLWKVQSQKNRNTMGGTRGAGTAYSTGTPEFTPTFNVVCIASSLVFCVVFCRSGFVFLSLTVDIVCPSIYGFWLPLWYLQTCLTSITRQSLRQSNTEIQSNWFQVCVILFTLGKCKEHLLLNQTLHV